MRIERFVLDALGHAATLVVAERTAEALLVDPRRDVEAYLDASRALGVRIAMVVDTHGHNDYVSGILEVAHRTGAEVLGSGHGELGYAHRAVRHDELITFGEVVVRVLHTPGHTPEHVAFLVSDTARGDEPAALLSGGSLLVGDVGRPDLLGGPDEAREAARALCSTVRDTILALPDHVEVFPTHVSGSLCASSIAARPSSVLGYERRVNGMLARSADPGFVDACVGLDDLPAVPPYWRRMRPLNLRGPAPLGPLAEPPALHVETFAAAIEQGAVVLDARSPEAFGAGHIPGAINVALGPMFPTWAGTALPEDATVVLVLEHGDRLWEATWHLLRIGHAAPRGWLAGGMRAWRMSARPLERLPQITVHELQVLVAGGEVEVLDVRHPFEWRAGHIAGARFLTGAELPERLQEVQPSKPLAVICGSGYRSSVSASLLQREGTAPVLNVLGGMKAWMQAGYETTDE